ncbi:venom metalloproteinase BumaMPs1-like isoform X1 [Haemaphysalis longicornis]
MLKYILIFSAVSSDILRGERWPHAAEVVFPQLFDARDELGTRILKINDKITLNLKKSSILEDGFSLISDEGGVPITTYPDIHELQEGLYHDERYFASLYLAEDDGFVKVNGVVGPNFKIKPLEGMERANEGFFPHVLELINKEPYKVGGLQGVETHPEVAAPEQRSSNYDRDRVEKVYPEIRVMVDSPFYESFNRTVEMVRYILIEFNVVRLRYLSVDTPQIHLKLRAIERLSIEIECTYYDYLDHDYPSVDGIKTLYNLVDYVGNHSSRYERYDILYVITGYDMARVTVDKKEYSYLGFAFVASVCGRYRVGFGEDTAFSYRGIRTWAHEVAHTLGCSHDGNAEWSYLPYFYADSQNCPWSQGYIMSYVQNGANAVKFSQCCDKSISFVARSPKIDCLHEINSRSRLKRYKTRTLPGYFLSRSRQCKLSYAVDPKTYYNKDNTTYPCTVECCVPWKGSIHCWQQHLLDGSRCWKRGRNRHREVCINGACVRKNTWYPVKTLAE